MQDGAHAEGGGADAEEAGGQAEGTEHATAGSGKSLVHDGVVGISTHHWGKHALELSQQPWPYNGVHLLYMLLPPCSLILHEEERSDA